MALPIARSLRVVSASPALPTIRLPHQALCIAGPSRLVAPFHTSSPASASRTRRILKIRKRTAHIEKQAAVEASRNAGTVDPVLGYVIPDAGPSRDSWKSPWEGCRLQRTLLRAESIYSAPLPDYSTGSAPEHYLPGLSPDDADILFGAVPHTSVDLRVAKASGNQIHEQRTAIIQDAAREQAAKVETMQRILDLRNSNKAGIEVVNRARVIAEFGRTPLDTGSSEVQAALLTQKIRSVAEHIARNPRDIANKRSLRMMIQERSRVLKYFKRTHEDEQYATLLADLGLEPRAVEGELTMPF